MKKIINIFTLFSLLLLFGCGYTPLYKTKNINFNISEIKTDTNNSYFYLLKNSLKSYTLNNSSEIKNIILEVNISKNKKILSKDNKGNPLVYSLEISSNFEIFDDDKNIIFEKVIRKKFKYNHKSEIFDLNQYEKNIEKNLIRSISDDIIILISKKITKNQ